MSDSSVLGAQAEQPAREAKLASPRLTGGQAASATPLPAWPDAWYVIGRSRDLPRGRIIDGRIAHRSFVVFRAEDDALVALDAHCPHMGAHLRTGQVVGSRIRCALHHMTIGSDGVLEGAAPCERFRSQVWPTFERFGLVFLFAGRGIPPAPPFSDLPDDYAWAPTECVLIKADWRAVLVNGFDTRHMEAVHQRALASPPEFSHTANAGLRMRYRTRVLPGGGLSSWLIRRLSGGSPDITQTCHGPTMLVESRLGRVESRAVFGLIAQGENTLAYASVGAPKGSMFLRFRLWVTRSLYVAFLRKDYAVIEGMRLNVDRAADPGVQGISEYLRSLPELGGDGRVD